MSFHQRYRQPSVWIVVAALSLFFILIGLLQARPQPLPPEQAQPAAASANRCGTLTERAAETLVPTPAAGELYFAAEQPAAREPILPQPVSPPEAYTLRWRIGAGVADKSPLQFQWPVPRPGWYLNWSTGTGVDSNASVQLGMEFAPMVRLGNDGLKPSLSVIGDLATQRPGQIWLIGNEPDVRWQDNATPEQYACYYHYVYHTIKQADSTAQVAIGGLSQITPLRLAYLDRIWASYQEQFGDEMPVDVWNMHAFVLREESDNWGVGIPPGFGDVKHGVLWEIEEHNNLILVENQVRLMRRWMAEHGQREKPLYITEYGILMPAEYGFSPYQVIEFMIGSFDLFATLRDPELGYPADDNRLVQRWVWFSTWYQLYPTGNLFDQEGKPSPLMRAMSGYIRAKSD